MSKFKWVIVSSLLFGSAGTSIRAQPAAPTSGPATTQDVIPSDQSTPRGALKIFTIAMNQGDADTVRSVLRPANPTETRMVDALIAHQQAILKLRQVAKTAYGDDGMKRLTGDVDAEQTDSIARLSRMPEKITGDTATVGEADQQLKFTKVDGKWVFPLSSLPDVDFSHMDQILETMKQRTQTFVDVTTAISAGKYKNADDAARDLQLKLLALAMKANATQPSSAPSSQPSAG